MTLLTTCLCCCLLTKVFKGSNRTDVPFFKTKLVVLSVRGRDQGGGKRRRCFADPNPRLICEAPFMDEAVVLVPEMWAASPALARTAVLAWACALGQRGAAAEALASS